MESVSLVWKQQEAGSRSGEVRRGQRGQRELLMWVGHFWGPLQGALSQFIDIQGFDPLTTGMSLRLRQPCLSVLFWAEKPGGPPAPRPPYARLSWWANQSSNTMSHSCGHILPFFLSFFSFSDFLSCCFIEGAAKESFLSADNAWCVMDIPIHIQCKEEQALKIQGLLFPKHMATDIFPVCCGIWVGGLCFVSKDMSSQVVNPGCRSSSPNNDQSYFIPQLQQWRTVAPVMPILPNKLVCYNCILTLVCLDKSKITTSKAHW